MSKDIKIGDLTNKGKIRDIIIIDKDVHPHCKYDLMYETELFQIYFPDQVVKIEDDSNSLIDNQK